MKLCVISLGGVTSKNIAHEAKNYYEQYYGVKKGVIKVVPNYVNTDLLMNLN